MKLKEPWALSSADLARAKSAGITFAADGLVAPEAGALFASWVLRQLRLQALRAAAQRAIHTFSGAEHELAYFGGAE